MSTANELFTTASGVDEAHIVINSDRSVSVPDELKNIAVQYDHNIETVIFDCPRYWDGNDLSTMIIKINYVKTDGSNGTYICGKPTIDSDNENLIHFDWLISNDVTASSGSIKFIVCVQKLEAGEPVQVWHSQINNQASVLPGLACDTGSISDYDTGRLTEWAEFWDSYQDNGNRTDYVWGFNGSGWNDTTFKPKYDLRPVEALEMFERCAITDLKSILEKMGVTLNTKTATDVAMMFYNSKITHIPVIDMSGLAEDNTGAIFELCTDLIEIEKIILPPSDITWNSRDWFGSTSSGSATSNLEEIRFEGVISTNFDISMCPKLSHDSILSIISCLKDLSETELENKRRVTLGTINLAKLSEAEIAVGTSKGWRII